MRKIFIIFCIFAVSVLIAPWLVLELPKYFKSEVPAKAEEKTKEINSKIASSNDKALMFAVNNLKEVRKYFDGSDAIIKEVDTMLADAEKLKEILKNAKKDDQKLQISSKITDFVTRYNSFIEQCNRAYIEAEGGGNNGKAAVKKLGITKEI